MRIGVLAGSPDHGGDAPGHGGDAPGHGERGRVASAQAHELRELGHSVERLDEREVEGAGEDLDLLHVHRDGADTRDEAPYSLRALAARLPVVVTLHHVPAASERAELSTAAALVASSRCGARAAELALGLAPGQVHVVPHGLCRRLPPRLAPAPVPRSGAPLVVAHFGPLGAAEGTLDLMRSLSLLPRGSVELRLGPGAADRALAARLWSGQHDAPVTKCLEGDDAEALVELLDGAHLCAFPAREAVRYGLAVDEALALGRPAWVSTGGAPAERLLTWGRPGRVLPARSPLAWAEAFCSVLVAPHLLADQRARVPDFLPVAGDAVRMLEQVMTAAAGRSAA